MGWTLLANWNGGKHWEDFSDLKDNVNIISKIMIQKVDGTSKVVTLSFLFIEKLWPYLKIAIRSHFGFLVTVIVCIVGKSIQRIKQFSIWKKKKISLVLRQVSNWLNFNDHVLVKSTSQPVYRYRYRLQSLSLSCLIICSSLRIGNSSLNLTNILS